MSVLQSVDPAWWWLAAAALLATAEIVAPGFFLIWLGGAALITGLVTLAFGLPDPAQLILFAVAAFGLVLMAKRFFRQTDLPSPDPLLNDRAARLIGQVVTVVEAVDEVNGRVRVGDSVWSARGTPADVGARVRVTGCEGNLLQVEPA